MVNLSRLSISLIFRGNSFHLVRVLTKKEFLNEFIFGKILDLNLSLSLPYEIASLFLVTRKTLCGSIKVT